MSSGEGRLKVLDLLAKKLRSWQPYQSYSKLYYDQKLCKTINASYLKYIEELSENETADSYFKFCNHKLQDLLEKEMSEVKAEVEALCQSTLSAKEEEEVNALLNEPG